MEIELYGMIYEDPPHVGSLVQSNSGDSGMTNDTLTNNVDIDTEQQGDQLEKQKDNISDGENIFSTLHFCDHYQHIFSVVDGSVHFFLLVLF